VDDLGNFTFEGIRSGEYDLVLEGTGREIHIQALEIKG
jgi:hypothetical protein